MNRFLKANSFSRLVVCACLAATLSTNSGCRICCNSGDTSYSAYGGNWARTDRTSGRVGSVFDPGGAIAPKLQPKSSVPSQRGQFMREEEAPDPPESTDPESIGPGQPEQGTDSFEERLEQFKEQNLESIRVNPGTPLPPDIQ